jgi:hypothetical protein
VTISWAGACMRAWEVSKVCLRGLRRRPAIDCHCMVAVVTNGDEGKTKGVAAIECSIEDKKIGQLGRESGMGRWPSTQAGVRPHAEIATAREPSWHDKVRLEVGDSHIGVGRRLLAARRRNASGQEGNEHVRWYRRTGCRQAERHGS